ncbi:hypothetical protein Cgig2_012363 [Carnegiea gigantea]|uniref:RRM domain-containing protein n=1 Tax=Carnegiea gigantea TaxID=171969 RepID=A0A9Q1KNF7_9CARY|nr:hypothetical protein Cgig2_012363 [Carnegiea gigantea]
MGRGGPGVGFGRGGGGLVDGVGGEAGCGDGFGTGDGGGFKGIGGLGLGVGGKMGCGGGFGIRGGGVDSPFRNLTDGENELVKSKQSSIQLPVDLDNLSLKNLFNSYGVVIDAYFPDKVGRTNGRKYRFVGFGGKEKGERAIEGMNGKFVGGHKLDVAWARFQQRLAWRLSDQRKAAQKKMVWKWISKKNSRTMSNVLPKTWRAKTFKWLLN